MEDLMEWLKQAEVEMDDVLQALEKLEGTLSQ